MIVCVLLPRFELAVAAGGREALARGPVALAPEPGREQLIGEASAAAEAYGVRAGLRLGEALARCPTLRLVAPDPAGVADAVGARARRARGHRRGGRVRAARASRGSTRSGLRNLHGGARGRDRRHPRRALGAPGAPRRGAVALRRRSPRPRRRPRRGAAGGGARAAAAARSPPTSRRCRSRCSARAPETAALPEPLERFGIRTLGELAALPRARAGRPLRRRRAARARPRPRARHPAAPAPRRRAAGGARSSCPSRPPGTQLEHALGLLIDRLLARRERRGRTLRAVVLSAALVEGGTWRARMTFREALADPRRMRLVLAPRLAELPAPADVAAPARRGLRPAGRATSARCSPSPPPIRAARLREAVRQARAVAGPDAALRILPVDPDSRVPERRLALAPWDP